MLTRSVKSLFYASCQPFFWLSYIFHRCKYARKLSVGRVHLGPGQRNYLPGWINVDANAFTGKCDIWYDLRKPLPFRSGSVEAFYSHHVIEHLPDLGFHLAEVYRCLKPGGVYRCGGPNGDAAIDRFLQKDHAWFSDFPVARQSIGGRFENFIFCKGEHLTILTESFMEELFRGAGFRQIDFIAPTVSKQEPLFADVLSLETSGFGRDGNHHKTILCEAVKK